MSMSKRRTRNSIAKWRRFRGLTQVELAARVGVTAATVRRWELGTIEPPPVQIARLAVALRCRVQDLSPRWL